MHIYSILREFADSWMLLVLTLFFIGTVIWAFRPGSRKTHRETSMIPFRNDTAANHTGTCAKNCPDCACKTVASFLPKDPS